MKSTSSLIIGFVIFHCFVSFSIGDVSVESRINAFEDFLEQNKVERSKLKIEQLGEDNIGVIAKSTIERNGQILKIPVNKIMMIFFEIPMKIYEN